MSAVSNLHQKEHSLVADLALQGYLRASGLRTGRIGLPRPQYPFPLVWWDPNGASYVVLTGARYHLESKACVRISNLLALANRKGRS